METIGRMTSNPDASGKHELKCPNCLTLFRAPILKDSETGTLYDVVCNNCGHTDQPIQFLYTAQKAQADKMAHDFVERKIKNIFNHST